MLGYTLGKIMRAGTIGPQHEVKIPRIGGMERGEERIAAGIGNGARRQTRVPVGVVGAVARQVGLMDCAPVAAVNQCGVDGGWVAIELHSDLQPVVKDRRNQRPVKGIAGLTLHQRRERYRGMYVRGSAEFFPYLAKLRCHHLAQLLRLLWRARR